MKSREHIAAALFLASVVAPACGGTELRVGTEMDAGSTNDGSARRSLDAQTDGVQGPSPGDAGAHCTQNSQCSTGEYCGYLLPAGDIPTGCTEQGACVSNDTLPTCDSLVAACSCDGRPVYVSGCGMYAETPFANYGACEDDGPQDGQAPIMLDAQPEPVLDAQGPGPGDAGANCTQNSQCSTGQYCGYLLPAGDTPTGCTEQGACVPNDTLPLCQVLVEACSCDSKPISVAGCGMYAETPFANYGACE